MGGDSCMSRRYGRRDVELGQKKCFTAEVKCGILFVYQPAKGGADGYYCLKRHDVKGERYETNH